MSNHKQPNIILILNDDMGYSDIGCYGGEVQTPNLDQLAAGGVRLTQFYNTARCCPSRASLLTGLHPHQTGVGHMMVDDGLEGYIGDLNQQCVTIAEVLKSAGYSTYMSGKWHVTRNFRASDPQDNWPCQRGFDDYYGMLSGAGSYYQPLNLVRNNQPVESEGDDYFFTDVISDEACRQIRKHFAGNEEQPLFQYVAYTAPHWPLHAHEDDIRKYAGVYDKGWDAVREDRVARMVDMGTIDESWKLSGRDERVPAWEDAPDHEWQARRMEVYAAQIDRMDQGIGRILQAVKDSGQWDNTCIIFLADNGGCAEGIGVQLGEQVAAGSRPCGTVHTRDGELVKYGNTPGVMPGPENTYQSYGVEWANASNTPFRLYKHWVHEGGISTPFVWHWPEAIKDGGSLCHDPAQLPDVMATLVDIAGATYPATHDGHEIHPCEGHSLRPLLDGGAFGRDTLYWEHEGNCAVRKGDWKLVCKYPGKWELYNMAEDRSELHDCTADQRELFAELLAEYEAWAERCGVVPWDELTELRKSR